MPLSISVIGSFKQHNEQIQVLCKSFRAAGVQIGSPQGANVIEQGIDFVRFHTDDPAWSDAAVQSLALHRILRSDLVYVVTPGGYIGRTTCYEVGRVIQAGRPIFFSEVPHDLPIHVPGEFILDGAAMLTRLIDPLWRPAWLYSASDTLASALERELIAGKFRHD